MEVDKIIYAEGVNKVIFAPHKENIVIYDKYNKVIKNIT